MEIPEANLIFKAVAPNYQATPQRKWIPNLQYYQLLLDLCFIVENTQILSATSIYELLSAEVDARVSHVYYLLIHITSSKRLYGQ